MGRGLKKAYTVIASVIAVFAILTGLISYIFRVEFSAMKNVRKVDGYGFFTMNYTRNYQFDELLSVGVSSDQELIDFMLKKLFKGIPVKINISDYACSTFNAKTPGGGYLMGRNFDWGYAPSMLVWTTPENGYKSVSTVNLGFMSYDAEYLPDNYFKRFMTMAAPYVPLDGMNEKGLAIGVLQLMDEETEQNTEKTDLTTTTMIRLVLDKAANVAEAIALFESYDMHDSVGSCYHYQLADSTGATAIVEYVDNVMKVIYPGVGVNYLAAANFYLTAGKEDPEGFGQDRYQIMIGRLSEKGGVMDENEAINLLKDARIESKVWEDGWEDKTQWSVVYNLTDLTLDISVGMNYEKVYSYSLFPPA
jgi:hypothetical protein